MRSFHIWANSNSSKLGRKPTLTVVNTEIKITYFAKPQNHFLTSFFSSFASLGGSLIAVSSTVPVGVLDAKSIGAPVSPESIELKFSSDSKAAAILFFCSFLLAAIIFASGLTLPQESGKRKTRSGNKQKSPRSQTVAGRPMSAPGQTSLLAAALNRKPSLLSWLKTTALVSAGLSIQPNFHEG